MTEPTSEQEQLLEEARAFQDAGDLDSALVIFQDILSENPTITTAFLGIGDIYMVRQDYAAAEPAFERAARLEPKKFEAQYGHGLALQMLQRLRDAVRAYRRALQIQPDSPEANLNIATSYLQLDDPDRALAFAKRAVELEPSSGPARVNLGAIYEKLGRNGEAVEEYLAALELMGNTPQLMNNLINVLAEEKRYREAANTAQTLARIDPTPAAYERLGWCYFRLHEYDQSSQAYRSAVALDPDYWPALNGMGINALNSWLRDGRTDQVLRRTARNAFRKSLRVNPEQPKLIKLLLDYSL